MRFELNFFPRPRSFCYHFLFFSPPFFFTSSIFIIKFSLFESKHATPDYYKDTFSYLSSFTDTETDKQGTPAKRQQENNNSVFANEKSPEKRTNGIVVETSNASMVNTPDLSPVKNIRNGEVEDTEVRKTKVIFYPIIFHFHRNNFRKHVRCMNFLFNKQRWPTDKAYYIAKELLMTERTYKKDLDMINVVTCSILTRC